MSYISHLKRQFYTGTLLVFIFYTLTHLFALMGNEPIIVPAWAFFGAVIGWIIIGPLFKMWTRKNKYKPSKKQHTGYSSSFE